jgi:hypothetical protein
MCSTDINLSSAKSLEKACPIPNRNIKACRTLMSLIFVYFFLLGGSCLVSLVYQRSLSGGRVVVPEVLLDSKSARNRGRESLKVLNRSSWLSWSRRRRIGNSRKPVGLDEIFTCQIEVLHQTTSIHLLDQAGIGTISTALGPTAWFLAPSSGFLTSIFSS